MSFIGQALKDCDLVPTDMTDAEIDLIFTAQRFQGWRAITFQQFQEALKVLADKTGLGYEKVYFRDFRDSSHTWTPVPVPSYIDICIDYLKLASFPIRNAVHHLY